MPSKENEETVKSRFLEFIKRFADIHDDERLFPKHCRSCGQEYISFEEYLCHTIAKKHVLQDYSSVMKRPYTMVYRHCPCGNTLVVALTLEVFPDLEALWSMFRDEADTRGLPLDQVVGEFSALCDKHLLAANPCLKPDKPLTVKDPYE